MTLTALSIHQIQDDEFYPSSTGLAQFDPGTIRRHHADAHWVKCDGETIIARCSLWWRNPPEVAAAGEFLVSHLVGIIGHFAATSDESGIALLEHAAAELAKQGCTYAVGPLDGNTWRNYRLVTDAGDAPAFFLEPQNRSASPNWFRRSGFSELAHYFSAVTTSPALATERVQRIRRELTGRDIELRPLRDENFEFDLQQIHAVARRAFRHNFLYQDISEAEFLDQYMPLRKRVPHDLILLAEEQGRVVGFVFGVPDLLQAERGEAVDTLVIKTLGVLPEREFAGIGQLLLEEVQQRAASYGLTRAIHAMVRETGHLQKISRRYATPFRRYALFGKELCR